MNCRLGTTLNGAMKDRIRRNNLQSEEQHRDRESCGTTLVEFAAALPAFLLLVLIILDFSQVVALHNVTSDALKQAGRAAAVQRSTVQADCLAAAQSAFDSGVAGFGLDNLGESLTFSLNNRFGVDTAELGVSLPARCLSCRILLSATNIQITIRDSVFFRLESPGACAT